ncbi:MAG: hypothetical protein K2Y71_04325 [Xanthobacteraceae bacterium]|nr:hypothetical protein [Xanthobacteraceae bacterium]
MTRLSHTDLELLLTAIAASEIVVPAPNARDFADWCDRQRPAEIDTVILDWLRAQVPQAATLS